MQIHIRQELSKDHKEVFSLIEKAFKNEELSDHQEQFLVERLRKSRAFVPGLSLVAEQDDTIVGHILLTRVYIKNDENNHESLALAPVSVLPEYQKRGIGGMLINAAHQKAKELDFGSIVLLGHDKYYPRFGYKPSADYGITFPFDAPSENCMAIELVPNALKGASGMVEYPKEFFQ